MAESNVLKTTIDVTANSGAVFVFGIPTLADEIKLGIRERNIRRELDPGGNGDPSGLDIDTYTLVRAAAQFELLLQKASVEWPYSAGADGKPAVSYLKFSPDKINEAVEVSLKFQADLNRFRSGGVDDSNGTGTEVVAGEPAAG